MTPFRRTITAITAMLAAALLASAAPAAAAPGEVGYRGQTFSGTGTMVTGAKPESKLWFNDGFWWASMWDSAAGDNFIYRLDPLTQLWSNTGVMIDNRSGTRADALWDGTKLYIASHGYSNSGSAGLDSRLYRYSYDWAADTYVPDAGYPAVINKWRTESLVIDQDAGGKLWATWVQEGKVYVNRTLGDDRTWGTPFALPAQDATNLTSDDISSVVAFGDQIGVMWSNQNSWSMNFSVHNTGAPDTAWSTTEAATSGALNADDHINLKAASDGTVYAAVKTEQTDPSAPLVQLLVRPPGGPWARHTFGRKEHHHTRPIVLLDETNRTVHMFATSGEAGGTIYAKSSSMDAISFPDGVGEPFLHDAANADLNDATSTKQTVGPLSGLAVMGSNDTSRWYWHNVRSLGEPPLNADFAADPTRGDPGLEVTFADQSTGKPTAWAWDFDNDGDVDSTARNPTHVYTSSGTYSVKLTVTNAAGESHSTVKTDLVTVASLFADFDTSRESGPAPLSVTFDDASTGAPTAWEWDLDGDGDVDSTERNPTHVYQSPGTYSVSLTVRDAAGTVSTSTRPDLISVTEPSDDLTVTPSADSYVRSLSPTTNYGDKLTLRAKDGGATGEHYRSFLRFDVDGLAGQVTDASLRLYVLDPAGAGGDVYATTDPWTETGLTWENQPSIPDSPLASMGTVTLDTWVDVPLPPSAFSAGDGTYTLAIKSPGPSAGTAWYASREDPRAPELVLRTG